MCKFGHGRKDKRFLGEGLQEAVGSWRLAVGTYQLAVGSWQFAKFMNGKAYKFTGITLTPQLLNS
jgi:hypothetical protein